MKTNPITKKTPTNRHHTANKPQKTLMFPPEPPVSYSGGNRYASSRPDMPPPLAATTMYCTPSST